MTDKLLKLWNDDAGALISAEYLFVATILLLGIVVGLTNLRSALNAELSELANAVLALSQGYSISGLSGCTASSDSAQALDTAGTVVNPTPTAPASPSVINVPIS